MSNVHATAGWLTVSVCPPMVIVPLRAAPLLAAALNAIDPLPVPDEALVIVIHEGTDVAAQTQPLPADTLVEPVPPRAGTSTEVGESRYVQGAAASEMVNVCPAMTAVPVRAEPEFAAAVSLTVPLPVPDAPEETVIHDACEAALHAQALPAETLTLVVPPDAPIASLPGLIE